MKAVQLAIERTAKELPQIFRYKESIYQKVLQHYLHKFLPSDSVISNEVNVPYKTSDGFVYAWGRMDLVVETPQEYIILELKANTSFEKNKEDYFSQVGRYIRHVQTKKPVRGMLIVFGRHTPIIKNIRLDVKRNVFLVSKPDCTCEYT